MFFLCYMFICILLKHKVHSFNSVIEINTFILLNHIQSQQFMVYSISLFVLSFNLLVYHWSLNSF